MNNYQGFPPQHNEYSDLDVFGEEAAPSHAFGNTLETVANGDYDCRFLEAKLEKTTGGDRVCRAVLEIGNRKIQHTYWLNRQESVNGFLAELAALGFPAHTWGDGPGKVPLSQAVPTAVGRLAGLSFRAAKTSRHVPGQPAKYGQPAQAARTFHDLRIQGQITGSPMPTRQAMPSTPMPSANETPAVALLPRDRRRLLHAGANTEEDDIPF